MSNLYVSLQICFGPCISCSLATPWENSLEGKLRTKIIRKIRPKYALLYLVQTHTSPCFSIKELIMQSSGMLGSICCWRGKVWIKKKNWKTNLDNHCTLLVLVILGLVLCKPGFRATNFSTDIAWPRDSLDMGFCVTLEVCLQKECSWYLIKSSRQHNTTKRKAHFGFCICGNLPADDTRPHIPILVDHRLSVWLQAGSQWKTSILGLLIWSERLFIMKWKLWVGHVVRILVYVNALLQKYWTMNTYYRILTIRILDYMNIGYLTTWLWYLVGMSCSSDLAWLTHGLHNRQWLQNTNLFLKMKWLLVPQVLY